MKKFTVSFYDRSPIDPQDFGRIQREVINATDEQSARAAFDICNCEVLSVEAKV